MVALLYKAQRLPPLTPVLEMERPPESSDPERRAGQLRAVCIAPRGIRIASQMPRAVTRATIATTIAGDGRRFLSVLIWTPFLQWGLPGRARYLP